jgi:ribonuclease P protein component
MRHTLKKHERLSGESRIEALFGGGQRGGVAPLRSVWLSTDASPAGVSVLFSVPKKVYKRAWKRNLIKRRMRESYRTRKHALCAAAEAAGKHVDMALICMASPEIPDFKTIDNAIERILEKILVRL